MHASEYYVMGIWCPGTGSPKQTLLSLKSPFNVPFSITPSQLGHAHFFRYASPHFSKLQSFPYKALIKQNDLIYKYEI
jgi:hypothetical protein